MSTQNTFDIKTLYPRWYVYAAIVLLSTVLIGYLFSVAMGLRFTLSHVIIQSFVSTVVIWSGCMGIVTLTWLKFPWETRPKTHLIVEVSFILIYLATYISCYNLYNISVSGKTFAAGLEEYRADISMTILITFLITSIHEAHFFYKQWQFNFSKSISLEKDNLQAQYNALKSQVNPHFLFNSLNSLMNLLEENPKAEQYVQNLSEYLRYVLLSSSRETVTLQEELENVEKYIALQKLRFGENFEVEVTVNMFSLQMLIPPLALQMLVENCIQHNIISKSHPLKVRIFDDENRITVVNNLQKKADHESTGNGLKNIEGRYRFAEEGNIKIESDEHCFTVSIPLLKNKS